MGIGLLFDPGFFPIQQYGKDYHNQKTIDPNKSGVRGGVRGNDLQTG